MSEPERPPTHTLNQNTGLVPAPDGKFYGVKAISAQGFVHDVKGIKMTDKPLEATVNGVKVAAHVKAVPQVR